VCFIPDPSLYSLELSHTVHMYAWAPHLTGPIRSDVWRAAYLFKYGGVYVDDDTEPMLPLMHFVRPNDTLVTGSANFASGAVNGNILIAIPGHPLLQNTLYRMLMAIHQQSTQSTAFGRPPLGGYAPSVTYPHHKDFRAYLRMGICINLFNVLNDFLYLKWCRQEGPNKGGISRACGVSASRSEALNANGIRLLQETTLEVESGLFRPAMLASKHDRRVVFFNHYLDWRRETSGTKYSKLARISPESQRWRRAVCPHFCL
jgi:hypothetical protein